MAKVLVIEDEAEIARVLKRSLEKFGDLEVDIASLCEKGLELASKQKYLTICTDCAMPTMSGGTFISTLRGNEGPNQNTPILMISGVNSSEEFNESWSKVYFIEKPFTTEVLHYYLALFLKEEKAA